MIWKSMISKLWATIIVLVSLVLVFLTVLLLQFFENNSIRQTETQMIKIGHKAVSLVQNEGPEQAVLSSIDDIADVYSAGSAVIINDSFRGSPEKDGIPVVSRHFFLSDPELKKVVRGRTVSRQVTIQPNNERIIVVGVPIHMPDGRTGGVYIYQPLRVMQHALDQAKKLIYISAGIAIILTTFFAFFLSTRIGSPLRRMRTAVIQVSHGNFDMHVPVITRDEVGELAVAFNKMRKELKGNITALNQEKEQLAGIVNNMADGVLLLDGRGQLRASNPPADRFLQSWRYEHKKEDTGTPQELVELFSSVTEANEHRVREVSVQGRFWVIIMTPLYNMKNVRGAVAVLRDMTEEKHIDQMKKGFVANVSHELRTPISMIQGYSEAIIDGIAGTKEEQVDMAQIILDESKRLGRLVNELLDLAKLEAGHFQLNVRKIPLKAYLDSTVKKFYGYAASKGIHLQLVQKIGDKVQFNLDPDRIEQVMTNLIDNAIRHTPEGGHVTVSADIDSGHLHIRVQDTGTGIAKEALPFVFERFYKEDKARTRGKSGTGLGLSIAKHIVDAHGGKISVNSRKGEGTAFIINLPPTGKPQN
ncbi:ATP-binding protein [Sporolactobacillus sp. THM19-2]|uniref:ATP-binding protein n=1 Tax=Sporolactobacillus sp. THM19-2 TaxID=2511171 RepID=UPI001022971D|nr:ATP-binding protein [Sporolactobacillus sp. THM19-2]RYL93202.1 HAMP domain-containing protein [Sporolactobacillus sp. THM19-2]